MAPPTSHVPRTVTVPEAAHHAGRLRQVVIGLRVLGSAVEHRIPADDRPITIGSADGRTIRLDHPSVSKLHARIERRDHHVVLVDCDSKNGCYLDDERAAMIHLVPGGRIRIGDVELVPYSHESDDVRRIFQRYLGYDEPAQRAVEDAHHAATRRRHLVLLGPPGAGSVAFARSIHKHTVGAPWPLVFTRRFHPDRAEQRQAHRFRESIAEQKQTLTAAGHGMLVMSIADLPDGASYLIESLKARTFGVCSIILGSGDDSLGALQGLPACVVRVPALVARRHELSRIVTDAVTEYAGARGASAAILTPHDYERMLAHDWPRNHDEVEEVIERLTVLRTHGRLRKAAASLGMSPGSLSEWARKYGFVVERRPGGRLRDGE